MPWRAWLRYTTSDPVIQPIQLYCYTSLYPAKGRPGSGSTKLDSVAQKRLRRSRIKGYGPSPRLARDWPVPLSYHRPARRRAGELARNIAHASAVVARARFLKVQCAILHRFPKFLHIKGPNFPDVFIRSRLPMAPMNYWPLISRI